MPSPPHSAAGPGRTVPRRPWEHHGVLCDQMWGRFCRSLRPRGPACHARYTHGPAWKTLPCVKGRGPGRPAPPHPTPVLSLPPREAVRQGEDGAMLTGGTGESGPEQKG